MDKDRESNDKYYDNDLPKEVVELLMKTHPLRGREDFDEEKYATRYTRHKDTSLKKEIEEFEAQEMNQNSSNTLKHETQNHEYATVNRHEKHAEEQMTSHGKTHSKTAETSHKRAPVREDDFEDDIVVKTVKKKPKPLKSTLTYTQREFDVDEIRRLDKEEELNKFFEEYDKDEYEDEYDFPIDLKNPKVKKFTFIAAILGVIVLIILLITTISLAGKYSKAKEDIETYSQLEDQNSELKLEINSLEEKITELESTQAEPTENTETAENPDNTESTGTTGTAQNTENQTTSGATDTYTVVDGDSFWTIAEKVYGNGAQYQKILDANGLTENDRIKAGQVLKIPK